MRHVIFTVAALSLAAPASAGQREDATTPSYSRVTVEDVYKTCEFVLTGGSTYAETQAATACGRPIHHYMSDNGLGAFISVKATQCGARLLRAHPDPNAIVGDVLAAGFAQSCAAELAGYPFEGAWTKLDATCAPGDEARVVLTPTSIDAYEGGCDFRDLSKRTGKNAVIYQGAATCEYADEAPEQHVISIFVGTASPYYMSIATSEGISDFYRCHE